jgi:hypothetical protein
MTRDTIRAVEGMTRATKRAIMGMTKATIENSIASILTSAQQFVSAEE